MTVDIGDIREALASQVGLQLDMPAHPYVIEPTVFPCVVINVINHDFGESFGGVDGDMTHQFQVIALVSRSVDVVEIQKALDAFVDRGARGVLAAIYEDDTLGLAGVKAIGPETGSRGTVQIGQNSYAGVTFHVEINHGA